MVGKYELIDRVGVGGMAEVFRAKPLGSPGRADVVVVKRILPHLAEDAEFRAMFMDEARIAACLDHPNVVKLIDLGRAGEELYLVLEYVDGASLSRLLSRAREKARRLPLSATLHLMVGVLAGLDHAHRRCGADGRPLGIVHRDVGPGNVLVSWGGSVKISDFGVAKATMRAGHTVPGVIKGNIPYMAPEQVTAERPVDARADVYGAGMLLHALLTGRNPLDDDPLPRALDRILSGNVLAPCDPDEVPPAMVAIVERATARDPAARFPDAAAFSDALWAAGRALRAEPSKMVLSAIMWELLPGPEKSRDAEPSDSGSPSIVKRLGPLIEEAAAEDLVSADLSSLGDDTPEPTPTPTTRPSPSSVFASALPRDPAQVETTHRTPHRTPTPKPDLDPVLDLDEILDSDTTKVHFDPLLVADPTMEPSAPSRLAPPPPEPSLTSPSGPLAWARLVGHREAIAAVAVTPDSRRAVSASHDQTLKIWDLEERREIATLAGHRAAVTTLALSADGRFALSGSRDRTVRLWSLQTGEELGALEGHTAWVFSVAISQDGSLAVSGGFDRTVRLWEVATGKCLLALSGHRDTVSAVAISDDGKGALSGSYDKTLRWWDLAAGSVKTVRTAGMDSVRAVKLWQNGPVALSGGADAKVRLWNLLDGSPIRTMSGHLEPVVAVAFSPDGKRIASGSYDGSVRIWSVGSGAELVRLSPGHEPVMALAFTPDGKRLVTAGADRQLAIFEL